ncbi:MAG TPA: hypothetical protein DCZ73_03080 [Bacteroides sp.]|nr:hypothetical protein [Bacteroides sp.]
MNLYQQEDIDYALDVLAHPELELTEAFRTWLQDETHRRLYLDLKAAHDGLALQEQAMPDVHEEWARFLKRSDILPPPARISITNNHTTVWNRRKFQVAAAAILLILATSVGFWLYEPQKQAAPVALMKRNPQPQEVVLSNDQGGNIILSEQTDRDSLASLGATLTGDQQLAYGPTSGQETTVSTQTLQTPRGKDFKIVLSDGTEVWLNAESTLTYPSRFHEAQRIVELDGEAYFKVAKDSARPFIVRSGKLETQVLGTSFNFRNYIHSTPHVTLVEGRVLVTGHDTSVTLHPNEDAQISDDGTIRVTQVDPRSYTAWVDGYFYFDNASLEEIMRELGRWYNLNILFENPAAMKYHFNFWASRKNGIHNVIELLNDLGKVKASLDNNALIIS